MNFLLIRCRTHVPFYDVNLNLNWQDTHTPPHTHTHKDMQDSLLLVRWHDTVSAFKREKIVSNMKVESESFPLEVVGLTSLLKFRATFYFICEVTDTILDCCYARHVSTRRARAERWNTASHKEGGQEGNKWLGARERERWRRMERRTRRKYNLCFWKRDREKGIIRKREIERETKRERAGGSEQASDTTRP